MAERLERPNGRMLILMTAATIGFGLLQGARLVDVNSGPYSASPLALWGLAVDGAVFLAVAALSYAGKIEGWRSLFLAGAVSSAAYVFMAAFAPDDMAMLALMQTFAGLGWSLNILCWMTVFVSYRSRYAADDRCWLRYQCVRPALVFHACSIRQGVSCGNAFRFDRLAAYLPGIERIRRAFYAGNAYSAHIAFGSVFAYATRCGWCMRFFSCMRVCDSIGFEHARNGVFAN